MTMPIKYISMYKGFIDLFPMMSGTRPPNLLVGTLIECKIIGWVTPVICTTSSSKKMTSDHIQKEEQSKQKL